MFVSSISTYEFMG